MAILDNDKILILIEFKRYLKPNYKLSLSKSIRLYLT